METVVTTRRKTLMKLSWEIQKKKHTNRSKSLLHAWGIVQNDDIVIYYLINKHSVQKAQIKHIHPSNVTLFKHS